MKCGEKNVKCKTVECKVQSVKFGVWGAKCTVQSIK